MLDPDGRKIFYSDGENNFDLPLDLIEEIYEKNEDDTKIKKKAQSMKLLKIMRKPKKKVKKTQT